MNIKLTKRVNGIAESATLAISAKAKRLKDEGVDVVNFGVGEPDFNTPDYIIEAAISAMKNGLTKYTPASGIPDLKRAVAEETERALGIRFQPEQVVIGAGAKQPLYNAIASIVEEGDEVIIPVPYWVTYPELVKYLGGKCVFVQTKPENSYKITAEELREAITPRTRAFILNSPNNPSGAVYSEATIKELAAILKRKEEEYGHPIYIISDEPYREIAYEGNTVPYIPCYYRDTLVCYSYSKSFSLPGERIGYIVVPDELEGAAEVYGAIAGAARVLTHVNAPSLWQLVVARCAGKPSDISTYRKNGQLLYDGLIEAGFTCVKPQGAFYLFPKALEDDDYAFCERAKKYDLLLVPGTDFGCPGYFRAAYCIKTETIERSLPLFKKLAEEYRK